MSAPVCPDCGEEVVMMYCGRSVKPMSEESARAMHELAIAAHRMLAHDRERTCEHCGSTYVVPAGRQAKVEHTFDFPPHASVAVWSFGPADRTPSDSTPLIHRCSRGQPYPLGHGSPAPEASDGEEGQGPRDQAQEGRGRR